MTETNEKFQALYQSPSRYFFVYGGRGGAKSFAVAEFILRLTYEAGHNILFTRYTMHSAEKSIIPEIKEKILLINGVADFSITKDAVVNKKTGSTIMFMGIKTSEGIQTARMKSLKNITTWVLDEAEELHDEDIFDTIDESVRVPWVQNRVIFVLNPRRVSHWIYKRFFAKLPDYFTGVFEGVQYIYASYLENLKNLSQSFLEKAQATKKNNLLKYKHRYLGKWLTESLDAIWRGNLIVYKQPGELKRIVISVDPAVTSNKNSDETGIIAAGVDQQKNGYVLADESGKYSPSDWAKKAIHLYYRLKADSIVAEVNQGGDLVKQIIRQHDPNVRVLTVYASRGKILRAEPVLALYEEGRVFHARPLVELEEQMLTWEPKQETSPDRIDALVHGLTNLLLQKQFYSA